MRILALSVALGGLTLAIASGPASAAPGTTLGGNKTESGNAESGAAPAEAEAKKQRFAEGVAAYDTGDYARAYAIWLPLAQGGDLAAQRNVGHLLRHGRGVQQDLLRAQNFYEQAGSHGLISAQLNAAFMHLNGEAAPADPAAAAFWFHKAAEAGASIAEYNLALMYETGRGVNKDLPRALGWYARAAQQGHGLALKRLSELVAELPGPPNPAANELSTASPSENLGPENLGPENLGPETPLAAPLAPVLATPVTELVEHPKDTEGERVSVSWDDAAGGVRQLVSPAQGKLFMEGKSRYLAGDYEGAAKVWGPLARGGVAEAQYRYGQLLAAGQGIERDMAAAYTWFKLAAAAGHSAAAQAADALRPQLSRDALDAAQQAEAAFRQAVPQ